MKNAVVSLIFFSVLALVKPVYSDQNFTFEYDYSAFKDENPAKVYFELYYSFNQNQLIFKKTDAGYTAEAKLSVDVFKKAIDKSVLNKTYGIPLTLKDTAGYDRNKKLVGQINMLLDTGEYKLTLAGTDFYDTNVVMKRSEDIELHGFSPDNPGASSIELASAIERSSDRQNIFYKNTLLVTPNPALLFGNNMPSLYYYLELYNMKKETIGDKYTLAISATDSKGNEAYSDSKNYNLVAVSKVEIGSIDLTKFTTDKYKLSISLKNEAGNVLAESSKMFYVYNPAVKDLSAQIQGDPGYDLSEFPKYTDERVNSEYEKMIYIISDPQKKQFEKLISLDSKRLFLYNFWKSRDSNPIKAHNEYFKRVEYANQNYRNQFIDGWKSDRGRVYIIYGPYDDIERHNYESQTKGYEIWTYNSVQGGAIFVFIDMSAGIGDYVLVHSTAQNEVRDDNWQDRLNIKSH